MRTSGKTNNTPGRPNLHKTGPGTEIFKKRSQSSLLPFFCSLPLSRLFPSLDPRALMPMDFPDGFSCYYLNKQSCNTDLFKSYNMVRSRPESYNTVCPLRAVTHQGALMSVIPDFCCDETKNRGAYTRVTESNTQNPQLLPLCLLQTSQTSFLL